MLPPATMTSVLFLCTGNAARSVMAGVALGFRRPDLVVDTAGTLSVDGLPISWRTRAALDAVALPWPRHSSKQATRAHLDAADVVIGMAPEHVEWVRRQYPFASSRTATLTALVDGLERLDRNESVEDRLIQLDLAERFLDPLEEVIDPGGGDEPEFIRCVQHVVALVDRLALAL